MRAKITYSDLLRLQKRTARTIAANPWHPQRKYHDIAIMEYLTFLFWKRSHKSRTSAWYAVPSQTELGRKAKISRRAAVDRVRDLVELDIITSTHRRNKKDLGGQTTNLYRPGRILSGILLNMNHADPTN